ncbi:hypothetical protein INS49_000263 [Diaporthe citri]|uniref:uncharacterized protein n=1 Tax=Diaporthe citri TaxID=83186 RepID=UPI001C7FA1C9|nr:uncharacterized protein INS49_000263 [Diaporthe citri]KAG6366087.1 hypothetical protein INS49_000263 [Diaporthe citri]
MSAHNQSQQKLPQGFKDTKTHIKTPIVQKYQQQVQELRDELTAARAEIKNLRTVPQAFPENLAADDDEPLFVSRESHDSSSDSDQDSLYEAAPCIPQGRQSAPTAPSEETLRCYATTIAYSSYSMLCGTSDRSLIHRLFEADLQKEPSGILCPKKMVEIPRGGHNIAYLREQIAEGASLFAARMTEARRGVHPEVTTDDHVRRIGPANIPGDNLPVYWIVTLSQQGVVDWEDGCSLARAYRRVFEDFGAEDVHCLVFESGPSGGDDQKAYAME